MKLVPIEGYEELYSVGEDGEIYSHRIKSKTQHCFDIDPSYKRPLKQTVKTRGYKVVSLYKGKGKMKYKYVHRLIAMAFIPNPQFLPQVNHIDGNKLNNSIENLEWCTHKYNAHHACRTGLMKVKGEDNPASKLTDKERRKIIKLYETGDWTLKALGEKFKVHPTTASKVITRWAKNRG